MRAGTVVDFDGLIDELEFRLIRCATGGGTTGSSLRKGGVLAAGENSHRIARSETRSFWNEHRIGVWSIDSIARLMDQILERPPRYLAWALVPILTELAPSLVNDEFVERIVDWMTDGEPVDHVVRDAFTMTILVKWLQTLPAPVAINRLVSWCDSLVIERTRLGCIGLGAFLRAATAVDRDCIDLAFAACFRVASRADVETALAVGWALRELLAREPERLGVALEQRVTLLSRQAFRTAIERLAPSTRARLSEQWLAHRREQRLAATAERGTGIRMRRFPIR